MEEEMTARGLIRAKIRTLKGNEVWRWVKPDNGNIIEITKKDVEKVLVADKTVVPEVKVIVPDPVVVTTPKVEAVPGPVTPTHVYKNSSYPSCCGASFFVPELAKGAPEHTDAEWSEMYEQSLYKRQFDMYDRYIATARLDSDKRYYESLKPTYSLEAFKEYTLRNTQKGSSNPTSPGIAVCPVEFPRSTQTPGGLWVRQDRDPVSKADKDHFEPAVVVDFEALIPLCLRDLSKDLQHIHYAWGNNPFKYDLAAYGFDQRFKLFVGMDSTNRYGVHPSAIVLKLWRNIIKGGVKEGDHVQFIMNQSQRNANGYTVPKAYAAAGFREVLRTGNSNHPGESTMYLYERVITAQDVKDATSIINQGFFNGQ